MDASPHILTRLGRSSWTAAALFACLTVVVTWPLGRGITSDIPSDYGDPLYAAWALAWVMRQMGRALTGHLDAITHFWDANQLYPQPASLALSDHFVGQALLLAPVYWIMGNPVLTLNLAYLTAYTLCGLSAYLLVREITGSAVAGVLAGVVFAVNDFFLLFEVSHLQMLSAHWMPLSLYALRRYFVSGKRRALVGAGCAIVMLNLSAGYYMLMFPLFVALYCAWELTVRRLWTDARTLKHFAAVVLGIALVTLPFVWPYFQAQQRMGLGRSQQETVAMAASVDVYIATARHLAVAYAFAAIGIVLGLIGTVTRRPALRTPLLGFVVFSACLALWLSLGPTPTWAGESYPALGIYRWLQEYVPGMSAIRVSSRFGVVYVLCLSVLAGMGAAVLVGRGPADGRRARLAGAAVIVLAAVSVAMNEQRPFPVNRESPSTVRGIRSPAPYLTPKGSPPAVYRYLASMTDPSTVVAEFPFTDLWYNTRYLFFSTFHWHHLSNGFTSFFPADYVERVRWLVNPVRTPEEAWRALRTGGVTHVVLHTDAWDEATAARYAEWLESRGARSHGRFDGAVVYELPLSAQPVRR